jgi:hypothetical protein
LARFWFILRSVEAFVLEIYDYCQLKSVAQSDDSNLQGAINTNLEAIRQEKHECCFQIFITKLCDNKLSPRFRFFIFPSHFSRDFSMLRFARRQYTIGELLLQRAFEQVSQFEINRLDLHEINERCRMSHQSNLFSIRQAPGGDSLKLSIKFPLY